MLARMIAVAAVAALGVGCMVESRPDGLNGDYAMLPREGAASTPCTDGETKACSRELSRNGDIINCFSGVTTCHGGEWGDCALPEDGGTVTSKRLVEGSDAAGTAGTKSLSEAGELKGICATNPCDPNCRGFDERPATAYSTTPYVSRWYENVEGFAGSPPGFIGKLIKEPCSVPADCGYDHHCEPSTQKCVRNDPGWTYSPSMCGGIDVTVGAACNVGGVIRLPVCNRGNVTIPAGRVVKLAIKNGDWIRLGSCPTLTGTALNCSHTLSAPLFPGACVSLDTCGFSGNAVAFVNADLGIAECPGSDNTLGCNDNWSDVKVVSCVERTLTSTVASEFSQQYVAKCPISARPAWQLLTYDASTPSNASGAASVGLEAQTAPLLSDGSTGAFGPLVLVAHTAVGDPAVCSVTGPNGCPKNLFAALGDPSAYEQVLNLKIGLFPTPDALLGATIRSWQVTYSCIPIE